MSRLPEQKVWDAFKRNTDKDSELRFWRIENLVTTGMADVYGRNRKGRDFWLENKALKDWPKRASTCPMRDVFEPGQVPFLKQICSWGGHAYVILRVESTQEWFMLHPKRGPELVEMTKLDMINNAEALGLQQIIQRLKDIE